MKPRTVDSAVLLSLLFGAVSLAWSLVGLLFPSIGPYRGHFTPALLAEVGGHFLFGLVAGAATGRLFPAMLTGLEAVLIDSDHLVSAAGFPIDARLSHSLPFILLSSLLVAWLGSRAFGLGRYGLAAVTLASFLTHLSFDIVAGDGSFPLLFPLSAGFYSLPYLAWPVLEAGAVCLCFAARRSWARSVIYPVDSDGLPP